MKYAIAILLLLTACQPMADDLVLYTIDKGDHYCTPRHTQLTNSIEYMVYVDASWLHTELVPGWNKLIGISDGLNHHRHSNRIAWRCIDGESITFAQLVYQRGEWTAYPFLTTYKPGRWVSVTVRNALTYYARVGQEFSMKERTGGGVQVVLYPYFGGQDEAPHTMYFYFRSINN